MGKGSVSTYGPAVAHPHGAAIEFPCRLWFFRRSSLFACRWILKVIKHNFLAYGLLMKQEQWTANNVPGVCLPTPAIPYASVKIW